MDIIKEKFFTRGQYIEVSIIQTALNDYIGSANFRGSLAKAISRCSSIEEARELSIKRLFENEELFKENTNN